MIPLTNYDYSEVAVRSLQFTQIYSHIFPSKIDLDIWLVGGFNPSQKYEFVSWDDDIPNWTEK